MPRKKKVNPYTLSRTEMNWIIMALNHDIAALHEERGHMYDDQMDKLADLAISNHERLVTKLMDAQNDNVTNIALVL